VILDPLSPADLAESLPVVRLAAVVCLAQPHNGGLPVRPWHITAFALLMACFAMLETPGGRPGSGVPAARRPPLTAVGRRLVTLTWWRAGWRFLVSGG
jgi:hypothetical protein